jgi:alkylation response protein AidB-like acyl-CoA dehydrogenase
MTASPASTAPAIPGTRADSGTADPPQALVLTEEQAALRDIARRFLRERVPPTRVRELMATSTAVDEQLWSDVADMGWQAMAIPEEFGGAGFGWVEVAVLFEEMGRAVAPLPMLATTMATAVLLDHGTEHQRATLLPGLAAGSLRMTVAVPIDGAGDGVTIVDGEDGTVLQGHASHVLDGASAHAAVIATDKGPVVVPLDRDGITITPLDALDPTRPLARLDFAAVPLHDDDMMAVPSDDVLDRARTVGAVMLANELVGVAAAAHEMGVEYARVRRQFGRAIGSFQAVKHVLADDLVRLEAARSAAWWAARVLAVGDTEELAVAVPVAASLCPEVAAEVTGHTIQVHGGIGFTWEHDAHLYYKRASAARPLLGHPRHWRQRLATTLDL